VLRIRYERTLIRKLTQNEVGVLARIPQPVVSSIEIGRLKPTEKQLARLAAVFGVAPDDLLKDVVVMEASR
jgi:transcriptional regulator with XRE-family HTH domain